MNSTISGNTATTDGAYNSGYNPADGSGGGISVNGSSATLKGLTVTNNTAEYLAAGLVVRSNSGADITRIEQSIISGNVSIVPAVKRERTVGKTVFNNLFSPNGIEIIDEDMNANRGILVDEAANIGVSTTVVDSNNIFGQSNDSGVAGFTLGASDMIPTGTSDTVIEDTLSNNGGNTLTHNLVSGSVAIDTGGLCFEASDQVGNIRNWNTANNSEQPGSCDAGAVEYQSIPVNDIIFKDGFDNGGIVKNND